MALAIRNGMILEDGDGGAVKDSSSCYGDPCAFRRSFYTIAGAVNGENGGGHLTQLSAMKGHARK